MMVVNYRIAKNPQEQAYDAISDWLEDYPFWNRALAGACNNVVDQLVPLKIAIQIPMGLETTR